MAGAEGELVGLGAVQLARRIATGDVSAAEVIETHLARIEQVEPRIHALVAKRFEAARAEAAAADAARRQGRLLGPLHGVPVTIKECFHLAGTDATMGVARLVGRPAVQDGVLVRRLRQAGAIVLGKTNVPQLMLMHECDNPVFGRTNNPWNLERSPGGSTGGEAAILAAGGSALGLGTDVGGSIRQPAHSCGICGLQPTRGSLPTGGCETNLPGMSAIALQPGPMARRVEDLVLAMRVLAGASEAPSAWLESAPPRWTIDPEGVALSGLRIAMWMHNGLFAPAPAIVRAVEEAAAVLRGLGATVEPWSPPAMHDMLRIYLGILSADGTAGFRRILGRSPCDWRIRRLLMLGSLPRWVRPAAAALARLRRQRWLAELIQHSGAISADAYWRLCRRMEEFTDRFLGQLAAGGYQAMLCPPHALPALRHGSSAWLLAAAADTLLPNVLGLPAGVVPVTRVRAEEQTAPRNTADRSERVAAEVEADSAGLPVGVQVVAGAWRDDVVLAIMAALEKAFSCRPDYPHCPPV